MSTAIGTPVEGAPHGTITGYKTWRCRCEACRQARRAYDRRRRSCAHTASSRVPDRAHTQRRILAALGGRLLTANELATEAGLTIGAVRRRLTDLREAGLVNHTWDLPAGGPLWYRIVPSGRVCAHPGCTTVLSQYNADDYCAVHAPLHISHREYLEAVLP